MKIYEVSLDDHYNFFSTEFIIFFVTSFKCDYIENTMWWSFHRIKTKRKPSQEKEKQSSENCVHFVHSWTFCGVSCRKKLNKQSNPRCSISFYFTSSIAEISIVNVLWKVFCKRIMIIESYCNRIVKTSKARHTLVVPNFWLYLSVKRKYCSAAVSLVTLRMWT